MSTGAGPRPIPRCSIEDVTPMLYHSLFGALILTQAVTPLLAQAAERPGREPQRAAAPRSSAIAWGDWDGDGRLDALALGQDGSLRLFAHDGSGGFLDVTAHAALDSVRGVAHASWQDVDGDRREDLFLAVPAGHSRLLRNTPGGAFEEVMPSGLELSAGVLEARWLDVDADGAPDLITSEPGRARLWRNLGADELGAGGFEEQVLELPGFASVADSKAAGEAFGASDELFPSSGSPFGIPCTKSVDDFSNPGNCMPASSIPMLGMLYPISADWFIDGATGRVGIGTTSPSEQLDVAGSVRASGRLVSTATSGAPLTVSSNTLVNNLNADRLDGLHASSFSQLGNSIGAAELENGAVTTPKIADGAVTTTKLAVGSVDSLTVANDSLTASDLAAGSVGNSELANGAVTSAKIANNAVGTNQILNGGVTIADLASNSVDSSKIVDGSVQAVDLAHLTGPATATGLVRATATGTSATALYGTATDTNATNYGVRGESAGSSGRGVYGLATAISGSNYGVYGASSSTSGKGVFGAATATSGAAYGVYGRTNSTTGAGVYGLVDATTGGGFGVLGETRGNGSGAAVQASALFASGTADGMRAQTDSSGGYGVWGLANVAGGRGVVGQALSGSSALHANGDLTVSGVKNFVQAHPTDASKEIRFTCLEGNESGTYFRGSGQLVGGSATIVVPELFSLVTAAEGLTVQLTPYGPARLWIESKGLDEIVVHGDLDVPFDYFVNGVRRGFEDFSALHANESFVPRFRGLPYGEFLPASLRATLVDNGILNPDFTPNEETASAMGWTLAEPTPEELALLGGAAGLGTASDR